MINLHLLIEEVTDASDIILFDQCLCADVFKYASAPSLNISNIIDAVQLRVRDEIMNSIYI